MKDSLDGLSFKIDKKKSADKKYFGDIFSCRLSL